MRKTICSAARLIGLGACITSTVASADPLTPGNVVAVRVGSGAAAVTNVATALFLDEYTAGGTLVQTFPLPTTGANACTIAGTSTTEGNLHVSADGNYMTLAGYLLDEGTASPAAATNSRTVARLSMAGVLDTTTHIDTTLGSANSIRGAVTDDGTRFWVSTADRGVVYLSSFGTTQAGVQLNAANTNLRDIGMFGGQLYVNSGTNPTRGVCTVGTGLPTTAGQVVTLLPGFPSATAAPYQFVFDTATRIFQGEITQTVGASEWVNGGASWSIASTVALTAPTNVGVAIGMDGVTPTLFVGTAAGIQKTPKATPGTLTSVVTAPTNTVFRGLAGVPPASAVNDWSIY